MGTVENQRGQDIDDSWVRDRRKEFEELIDANRDGVVTMEELEVSAGRPGWWGVSRMGGCEGRPLQSGPEPGRRSWWVAQGYPELGELCDHWHLTAAHCGRATQPAPSQLAVPVPWVWVPGLTRPGLALRSRAAWDEGAACLLRGSALGTLSFPLWMSHFGSHENSLIPGDGWWAARGWGSCPHRGLVANSVCVHVTCWPHSVLGRASSPRPPPGPTEAVPTRP